MWFELHPSLKKSFFTLLLLNTEAMHKTNQVSPEVSCPADGWKEDDGLSTISLVKSTTYIEEDGDQDVRIVNPNTVTQHDRHYSQHFSVSEVSANTRTALSPSAQINEQGRSKL